MGNVLAFGYKTTGELRRGLEVIYETRKWLEQAEGYYALAWTAYLSGPLLLAWIAATGIWLTATARPRRRTSVAG